MQMVDSDRRCVGWSYERVVCAGASAVLRLRINLCKIKYVVRLCLNFSTFNIKWNRFYFIPIAVLAQTCHIYSCCLFVSFSLYIVDAQSTS